MEYYGRNGHGCQVVEFITDDNALSELVKFFKPTVLKYQDRIDGKEYQLTMDVELKNLLTEIPEDEYSTIIDLLSNYPSKNNQMS